MDLAKIQKINSLASELKKHHFADSSQDAFAQAEQTFEPEAAQQIPSGEAEYAEQPVEQPVEQDMHTTEELDSRRTELLIEINNKKYEQEFSLLRSALNTLAAELSTVKGELGKIAAQQPKEVQKPLETKPVEKVEPHPRQGNTTPEDVDIHKMFYYGNK